MSLQGGHREHRDGDFDFCTDRMLCLLYLGWNGPDCTVGTLSGTACDSGGENTLSVIVIDDNTGLTSNIFRAVYNCSPATEKMEPVEGPVEEEM